MTITPDTIRNASFALMPTGYSPEQVEETLAAVADQLANSQHVDAKLLTREFDLVTLGYAPTLVEDLFATLREALLSEPTTSGATRNDNHAAEEDPASQAAPDGPVQPEPHPEQPDSDGQRHVTETSDTDSEPAPPSPTHDQVVDAEVVPFVVPLSSPPPPSCTSGGLPGIVERTKLAVSELDACVIQHLDKTKTAVRLRIDQTQTDCLNILDNARTISDQVLDTARQRADALLGVTSRATTQLRDQLDTDLARIRQDFEEELTLRQDAVRADLERLVDDARHLTDEAHTQLLSIHHDVRASLQDARSILTDVDRKAA